LKPKASPTLNSRGSNSCLSFSLRGRSPQTPAGCGIRHPPAQGEGTQVAEARGQSGQAPVGPVERRTAVVESFLHHAPWTRAGEVFRNEPLRSTLPAAPHPPWAPSHQGQSHPPVFKAGAQRIGPALGDALTGPQPVDDDSCGGRGFLVELDCCRRGSRTSAIDPHPGEAFGTRPLINLAWGALLPARTEPADGSGCASGRAQGNPVEHLNRALRPDRALALGAMGLTGTAKRKPQGVGC